MPSSRICPADGRRWMGLKQLGFLDGLSSERLVDGNHKAPVSNYLHSRVEL